MGTREKLIDAATALVDAGGARAVTLREVGRAAGVSHNAPYKHFAGKEALLAAVAAAELERRTAALAPPGATSDPLADLRRILHGYVAWARATPERFRLVFGPWQVDSPELASAAAAAQRTLVDAVARAQTTGALPGADPERLGALLRATAHGAADLAASGHLSARGKGHADPEDLVDDLVAGLTRR